MYCSNGSSSMATLLQQKNCMKTLTNGSGAGSSGQGTRVLLPHEMVNIPTAATLSAQNSTVTAAVHHGVPPSLTTSTIPIVQQHNQHLPHQQLQTIQHHHIQHNQFNNFTYFNTLHSNNDPTSIYRIQSTSTPTSTLQHPHHLHQQQHQHQHPHGNVITGTNVIHSSSPVIVDTSTIGIVKTYDNRTMMVTNINPNTTTITGGINNSTMHSSTVATATAGSNTTVTSSLSSSLPLSSTDPCNNGADQNQTQPSTAIEQNATGTTAVQSMEDEETEAEPEIDIVINNVVCSFSVRCHLNLREIALNGINVEFRRENGMVTMKLRRPYTTASIWSSGRITCTGATSEDQAKIAARRYARCLQKLGFSVKFRNFRVVNVLGTCSMPWAIKIVNFSEKFKKDASYEPELHPGVTYKLRYPKATLKIFSTGSITVTASSVANVQAAIEHIFPLVYEFRKKRSPSELKVTEPIVTKRKYPFGHSSNDSIVDNMFVSDNEDFDENEDEEEDL